MTPKQKRVFDYIATNINESEICPSYSEIMKALNISSKSIVSHYLNMLEKDGKIKIKKGRKRGIEIVDKKTKLKKQLAIAIEALKCYEQENWTYADEYNYFRLDEYTGGWCHAEKALEQIKELEKHV